MLSILGIEMLVSGLVRTWIAERGVQIGARLYPWEHIESWQWKPEQTLVLTLKKGHGEVWGRMKVRLSVPADQYAAVERVFAERLPGSNERLLEIEKSTTE
jgi:hypothetical protein